MEISDLPAKRNSQSAEGLRRGWVVLLVAAATLTAAQLACGGAGEVIDELSVLESVQGDWIEVRFTQPNLSGQENHQPCSLARDLALAIDQAQEAVDLAAYNLDLTSVSASLVAAHERGVRVRVVTESQNAPAKAPILADLRQAGIRVVEDEREAGLMHDKFVIIDGGWTWTGSWNMTESGTHRNNNNAVAIRSPSLAENYTVEFEEMMAGQFGPDSPRNTPHPRLVMSIEADGERERQAEIETYFAPEDAVADEIIDQIGAAEERIRFLAFVFTSDEIADAMLERAETGVVVQGVMESRNTGGRYDQYPRLKRAVHDVLLDGNPYIMHHKVIIIDDETVILGSYNFSHSAESVNDENVLIIHDPVVAGQFVEEFGRVYEQARNRDAALDVGHSALDSCGRDIVDRSQLGLPKCVR